jgi:hypothetical protein
LETTIQTVEDDDAIRALAGRIPDSPEVLGTT